MNKRQRILVEQKLQSLRQQLESAALQVNDNAEVPYQIKVLESILSIIRQAEIDVEIIRYELERTPEEISISGTHHQSTSLK